MFNYIRNFFRSKKEDRTLYSSEEKIILSDKDYEIFIDNINNPNPPNDNLKKSYNEYRFKKGT